jgi:hypothetical protein
VCGTAVAAPEPTEPAATVTATAVPAPVAEETATTQLEIAHECESCGAHVAPGAHLCDDCERLSTPRAPVAPAPPAAVPPSPPPAVAATSPPDAGGRGFLFTVVAIVLACGALGGAGAYFFVLKEDEEPKRSAVQDAPASEPLPSASTEEPENASSSADPAAPSAEPEADVDSAAAESTSDTLMDGSAAALLEDHYRLIDDGDYQGAWALFHPAYRDGAGARWVDTKYKEMPDIDLESLVVEEQRMIGDDMVRVTVDLVAADTSGDGAGICRHFVGWARVQKTADGWLYRPGEVDGIKPGLAARSISDSDPRCQRVLG